MSVVVSLETWEYQHATTVGIGRFTARWGSVDAPHYSNKARQEDNRTANMAAAICELAVAKLTNRYWHGHIWDVRDHHKYRHLPDVGDNIEVRRLRTRMEVPIRKHQNNRNGLVVFAARLIDAEMRDVEIFGYITQKEGWEIGTFPNWDDGKQETKVVPVERLYQYSNQKAAS